MSPPCNMHRLAKKLAHKKLHVSVLSWFVCSASPRTFRDLRTPYSATDRQEVTHMSPPCNMHRLGKELTQKKLHVSVLSWFVCSASPRPFRDIGTQYSRNAQGTRRQFYHTIIYHQFVRMRVRAEPHWQGAGEIKSRK